MRLSSDGSASTYVTGPGKFPVNVFIPEGYMNVAHKN